MRKYAPYLILLPFLLLGIVQAFAAALSGTNISAPVVPFTDADSYPSHDAQYGKGGVMQYAYSSQRRTIPETRRTRGMLVYAHDTRQYYQLYSTPGHNWRIWITVPNAVLPNLSSYARRHQDVTFNNMSLLGKLRGEIASFGSSVTSPTYYGPRTGMAFGTVSGDYFSAYGTGIYNHASSIIKHSKTPIPIACGTDPATAIFDGAPALSCAIDSGSLAFTYDPTGANPLPDMLPYTVKLYEVGLTAEAITPDSIHWSVPASNTLLVMGQYSTQSTFSPVRFGTYSASKSNNWIKAVLTKGLKTCIAMLPVSATKIGATGPTGATGATGAQGLQGEQGPPGESATITKPAVQGVFTMDNPGGTSFTVRPNSSTGQTNDTPLITVGDLDGYRRTELTATSITTYKTDGTTRNFSLDNGVLTLW